MPILLRTRRNSALSLLVILALGLGLLISVKIAAHASGSAAITLSPAFGPPTTPVTVSGTGSRADAVNGQLRRRRCNKSPKISPAAGSA
jgi:hypothetical protein